MERPAPRHSWAGPAIGLLLACAGLGAGSTSCGPGSAAPVATLAPSRTAPAAATSEAARPDPGFIGVVVAGEWTDLEPKVEGRIEAVLVKAGDQVARGTVVARLDVQVVGYELMAARAALRDARGRYLRRRKLAQRSVGAVAQEELEGIRREMLQEQARVARLARARDEATVVAPFAGSVVERYLSPGALAGPGRPVVRLATRSEPRVRFAVPEEGRARLLPDAALTIRLASPAASLPGRVSGLSQEVDDSSGMIFATATFDPPRAGGDPIAAPGQLATGVIARVFLAPGPAAGSAPPGRDPAPAR